MKFGLYSSIANPPRGEHLDRCIDEVIAEAQLAEASGFDSCFFGEHHQDQDGFLPSPLIVATAVAARTKRLRVGTSVILLPLHHPVRVAEDVITLDLVSRGRVGRIADGFVGTPSTSLANATALADIYKEAARKAGRVPEVVQMRDAWVAPTRADADLVYGPHVMTAYRYYWEHRLAEFANMPADTKFTLENLAPDRLILGDPETCVREFQRWQKATGASTFLLRLRHAHSGGPPHEKIMDAIRLFGERVLPYCGSDR